LARDLRCLVAMQPSTPADPIETRVPTLLAKVGAAFGSLVLALALGELIATCAMGGVYPTLNIYEPDLVYGVHLTPDTTTRVVSPDGTVTDFRTNGLGFRGDQWPPKTDSATPIAGCVAGRVLVVGDSQVMGWGVAEEAVFVRHLDGYEVLAAGVPTWGPLEYARAVSELVPSYRPERVVLVINAANDWQEAPLPNFRRTTARDGWARVPLGTPEGDDFTDFPLRRFLLGRSHLVMAVRFLIDPPSKGLPPVLATRFMGDLPIHLRPDAPYRSRITRQVEKARAVCARLGCELMPVLLPMDIQVHPSEWAKYLVPPLDARPSLVLATALQADEPDLVDLMPALVRASPGAFLPDDYHLSAAGHAAVAAVLRERLARPFRPQLTTDTNAAEATHEEPSR